MAELTRDAEARKAAHEAELAQIKTMMVNVMREGERLKHAIEASERETEQLRRERNELREEGKAREDDRRTIERSLATERRRRETKEAELERREEEAGRLREQIRLRDADARAKLHKLEEELREKTASEARLQQLHNAALKQVLDFNEGLNRERVERAGMDLDLREKQRVLLSMEEEINRLKVEVRRKEQAVEATADELAQFQRRTEVAAERRAAADAEFQQRLATTEAELKQAREQLARSSSKAESLEQLKAEIRQLQGRLQELDRLAQEGQEMQSQLRVAQAKLREAEERTREAETRLRDEEKRAKVVKARMDQLRSAGKTHERTLAELQQREEHVAEREELINRRAIELELRKESLNKQASKQTTTTTTTKKKTKPMTKPAEIKVEATTEKAEIQLPAAVLVVGAAVRRLPGGGVAVRGMHAVGWVMQFIAYVFVFLYVLAMKGRSALSWRRT